VARSQIDLRSMCIGSFRVWFSGVSLAALCFLTVPAHSLYTDHIVNLFDEIGTNNDHDDPDSFNRGPQYETQGIKTKVEDDVPHPIQVNNWGHNLKVGQVSGVAVTNDDYPVIFHRGPVVWNKDLFDADNKLKEKKVIDEDTILILDPDNGEVVESFGKGMFYVPHGLTVDNQGNIYVTDVGLHQVKRFPPGQEKPDLVLGRAFEPGSDTNHFCKPTAVAVSESTGDFFVADGYCNSRIMKYSKDGKLKRIINSDWSVPHSLALFERVDCIKAGLQVPRYANQDETGMKVVSYPGIGRVYAVAGKGTALLALTKNPTRGLTIDTAGYTPTIIDVWGFNEGLEKVHDVAISPNGDAVYVAETNDAPSSVNIRKFEVVNSQDEMIF